MTPYIRSLARGGGAAIAYCARHGRADRPGVVFLHGYRSNMTGEKASAVEAHCVSTGQAFIRFDYQGHGESTGSIEESTVGIWLEDVLAAMDQLTAGPQILVGSSLGGWLALLAARARAHRVAGLILIAPATDFTEALVWERLEEGQRQTLMRDGIIQVPSAYDPAGYPFTRRLIEEARNHLILGGPIDLSIPIRILHGMRDDSVPWEHSLKLINCLTGHDVRMILVKDADHRLSRGPDLALLLAAMSDLSDNVGTCAPDDAAPASTDGK